MGLQRSTKGVRFAALLFVSLSACRAILGIEDPGPPLEGDAATSADTRPPNPSDGPAPVLPDGGDAGPDRLDGDAGIVDGGPTFCTFSDAAFCEDFDRTDASYTAGPAQIPGSAIAFDSAAKSSPRAITISTGDTAATDGQATLVTFPPIAQPAAGATRVIVDFDVRVDQAAPTTMVAAGATVVWIRDAIAATARGAQLVRATDTNLNAAFRFGAASGPIVDLSPQPGRSWAHAKLVAPLASVGDGRLTIDNSFSVEGVGVTVGAQGPILLSIGVRLLPPLVRVSALKLSFDNVEVRFD